MPTLKGSTTRYLIAAFLGFQLGLTVFIVGVVIVNRTLGDGPPGDIAAYALLAFAVLVWIAATLLIVYLRAPLTYTKKTFEILHGIDPWFLLAMPAFALATFPIDFVDAIIAWRRRTRRAHTRPGAVLPARDRNSD